MKVANYLIIAAGATLTVLSSCSFDGAYKPSIRLALRAAWGAYTMRSPIYGATTADVVGRATSSESIASFDAEGMASINSLDSALSAIPIGGGQPRQYLRQTLARLVSALRDRHSSELSELRAEQRTVDGVRLAWDARRKIWNARVEAGHVADGIILRLAAWERRYLHETSLVDSYNSWLLAGVEGAMASDMPDSLRPGFLKDTIHRLGPVVEGRIAWADSAMLAEIARTQ
ncbi:MAG TPA: hypothetical protein VN896_12345 [Methylomirabilota bacterium]|nr:hypothetical protein [Methylomirabilota bacterium]